MKRIPCSIFLAFAVIFASAPTFIERADAVPSPTFGLPDIVINLKQPSSLPISLDDSNFEFMLDDLRKLSPLFKDEIMPEVRKVLLEHEDELVGQYVEYVSVDYDMEGLMRIEVVYDPFTFPDTRKEVEQKVSPGITTLRHVAISMAMSVNSTTPEMYRSMVNRLEEFNIVRTGVLADHAIETLTTHRDKLQNFTPTGEPTSPDADNTGAAISLIVLKMFDTNLARTTIFYPVNDEGGQPVAVDEVKVTGLSTVPEFLWPG